MGQRPAYDLPTTPLGFRVPEPTRRIVEYLTLVTGAPSVSAYVRALVEKHLAELGFELVEGVTAALGPAPSREAIAAWQTEEAQRVADRAVG